MSEALPRIFAGPPAERRGATPPTYYDQPALKSSEWGGLVSGYIFIGGLAGASQLLATVADVGGGGRFAAVVRNGRYLALAGALAGGPLLIADLKTPQRFYNMLRIFRPTSPMSIGSYVLIGFGLSSAILAGAQFAGDRGHGGTGLKVVLRLIEIPAAATGAAMASYTGALLAATSTPLWAAAPRLLPALFGASAMASAAAALSLVKDVGKDDAVCPALDRIALAATLVELGLAVALRRRWRTAGIEEALGERGWGLAWDLVAAFGIGVPALAKARREMMRSHGRRRTPLVAALTLAGGFLLRDVVLRAGNASAMRPRDYFRFARPPEMAS